MELLADLFTVLVTLILPCLLLLYFILVKRRYLLAFIIGVLTFTIFQVLTRMPLLQLVLPKMDWYFTFVYGYTTWYVLFLGITAALFEEIGRYIMMRLFLKNNHRFGDAVSFGLGHGGIEAILFVGINALNVLILYHGVTGDPLSMFYAGLERASTMVVHVFWSVLVMKAIVDQKRRYLFLAIIMHALVDSLAVLLQLEGASILSIELIMVAVAVVSIVWLLKIKRNWGKYHEKIN